MSHNIYLITKPFLRTQANAIADEIFVNRIFEADGLDKDTLLKIAKDCRVEYFYVIRVVPGLEIVDTDFNYRPEVWDSQYIHAFGNTVVRLFNKKAVLDDIDSYVDNGTAHVKFIDKKVVNIPDYDIVYISYMEPKANENFQKIKDRFPKTKRVVGVKGIFEAHKAAAQISTSNMFYVIDADAEILPTFDLDCSPVKEDNSVYVWHSRNPINGLEYGYGGIKLFPTDLLLNYTGSPVDFTTTVSRRLTVIPEVSNITKFNTDPFSTWRSAFRECTKLSSKVIVNQHDEETEHRLNVWCTVNNGEFGKYAISGALAGKAFGELNMKQPELLGLINDFNWLEQQFKLAVISK